MRDPKITTAPPQEAQDFDDLFAPKVYFDENITDISRGDKVIKDVYQDLSQKAQADERWQVAVQLQEIDPKKEGYGQRGHDMARVKIYMVSPEGDLKLFDAVSGGYGEMLPGLRGDIDENRFNGMHASYGLNFDHSAFFVDNNAPENKKSPLPKGMVDGDNVGNWFKLEIPDYADNRTGLGLHNDGGPEGTLGCVALDHSSAKEFFELLQNIPENQRPKSMDVLPDRGKVEQKLTLGQMKQESYALMEPFKQEYQTAVDSSYVQKPVAFLEFCK